MGADDLQITPVTVDRVMRVRPREILTVHAEDTLADVSRQFERKRTAVAMVVDEPQHLIGVVSLGDIVHAIGERGAGALSLPIRTIMSYDVATCEPGEPAESALQKMTERDVKHLPVVENGRLLSCVEKIDALQTLYEEAELDFAQLRNYVFKTGGRY